MGFFTLYSIEFVCNEAKKLHQIQCDQVLQMQSKRQFARYQIGYFCFLIELKIHTKTLFFCDSEAKNSLIHAYF